MIRRFTEYRAIIVRMPAKRAGIFSLVVRSPVMTPASIPAIAAKKIAVNGSLPLTSIEAATAAPRGKLPSTVRSAISSTRNVR